jgi:Family of unknown function (DUF6152)
MTTRFARLVVASSFLMAGVTVGLEAHHAVAGVYDLNKEIVLEGRLDKLNFTNPHASIEMSVPNADGTVTHWKLTTASVANLTRAGVNKESIKPGEILKAVILPAKNGNPAGFIRSLTLGDNKEIKLFFGDERD